MAQQENKESILGDDNEKDEIPERRRVSPFFVLAFRLAKPAPSDNAYVVQEPVAKAPLLAKKIS